MDANYKYLPIDYLIILEDIVFYYYSSKKSSLNSSLDDIALFGGDITIIGDEDRFSIRDPAVWYEWLTAIDGKKETLVLVDGVWNVIEKEREITFQNKS